MEIINAASWDEAQEAVTKIRSELLQLAERGSYISRLLFRGHADSNWKLETTLQRYTRTPVSMDEYFQKLGMLKPRFETFTGRSWTFDTHNAREWAKNLPIGTIPGYEFMVFLRHHGFPSPLLDWTESSKIAAFFAYRDTPPSSESVAIYAFCDYVGAGRSASSDKPCIHGYGPFVATHARHFLQQSSYTICTVFREGKQYFANHEDATGGGRNLGRDQDWLWKITVPASERGRVLRHLAEYNLTPFSLFASTESLAETLALEYYGPMYRLP